MDEQRTMNGRDRVLTAGRAIGCLALLLSLAVIVAACGNGGEEDAAADVPEETDAPAALEDAPADEAPADETPADEADDAVPEAIADLASETGSATVTIGDETYEFSLAGTKAVGGTTYVGRCETLFGMIIGSGYVTDERDITVDMEV